MNNALQLLVDGIGLVSVRSVLWIYGIRVRNGRLNRGRGRHERNGDIYVGI